MELKRETERFLTLLLNLILGDAGIITPYLSLRDETEIIFKPKLILDNDFDYIVNLL